MKKILIFFVCVIILVALLSLMMTYAHKVPLGEKVALVRVEGIILDSRNVIEELKKYSNDPSIKAVVLRVDSPGGAVAPAQEIYEEIKKLKGNKKIVASMGSVAASGGYYIACAADKIMANSGTLTGSIGVIMEIPSFEGLMKKIGVEAQVIKSGKHKDMASAFRSMSEDEKKILQGVLDDVHEQFITAVSESRAMNYEKVKQLSDGRIFTGRKAKELGLIDELGTLEDAISLAGILGGIKGEPEVVSRKSRFSFWDLISGNMPEELFKNSLQTIKLKYMFTP